MDQCSCLEHQLFCSYLVCKLFRRMAISSYDFMVPMQLISPCFITQAVNIPSGRGSSVFVPFFLQKKLIPWLCAIASCIFRLIMA